jgi:transposase-like protein
MISIDNFSKNITKLFLLGEKNIRHMYGCSCCGYEGMLHSHGHYHRNVVTLHGHFVISIQRFLCPSCGKTYSLLPSFLIPYFIYSFDVVIFCLYSISTLPKMSGYVCRILHRCNKQCFITIQSISFFSKRFLSKIYEINSFFASMDSYHYDSDFSILQKYKASAILFTKILCFNNNNSCDSSFNYEYFKRMPKYFLSS